MVDTAGAANTGGGITIDTSGATATFDAVLPVYWNGVKYWVAAWDVAPA